MVDWTKKVKVLLGFTESKDYDAWHIVKTMVTYDLLNTKTWMHGDGKGSNRVSLVLLKERL